MTLSCRKESAGAFQFGFRALRKVTFQQVGNKQQNQKKVIVCTLFSFVCFPSCSTTGMYL